MLDVTLNPGIVPMLAALLVLAAPRALRAPTLAGAALLALWLLLDQNFGVSVGDRQMGLNIVPLDLDALNRIFGIAMLISLIIIAVYSSARRNRYEDAAILALAGGSVSALFVGDLIIFVAAAAVTGLSTAWVVFASPQAGAGRAGIRLLVWHGLEGLLFLVGVALHLSAQNGRSEITRLDVETLGGGFIFAALMIRIGAPLAHVWLKDAVSHASPTGAAAISVFASMLGVYALARCFPAEPLLVPIGAALVVVGLLFAAAEDNLRAAGAYGLAAVTGVCVALIGVGSPLAMAAAEGYAFTAIFAFMALQMALGCFVERAGAARLSALAGFGRSMPFSTALLLLAGLATAAAPGLAPFVTHSIALEAVSQWPLRWLWTLIAAAPAVLLVCLALRPVMTANLTRDGVSELREAPYAMLLGSALACFFCVSIGVAPGWLYGLMPTELAFQPYALDRMSPQFELLGAAGVAFVLLRALRLAPKDAAITLLDIDALYRGPLAAAGRWLGVVALRFYGTWQVILSRFADWSARQFSAWTRSFDRPYARASRAAFQLAAIVFVIVVAVAARGL